MKHLNYSIHPKGWLLEQMESELKAGVIDHLDTYVDDLFSDDIYDNNRLSVKTKPKELGTIEDSNEWNVQFYWWNSETISNYYDGLMRYGFLLNNQAIIKKVRLFKNHILNSQDEDGYIGIYDKYLRYNFTTENGELWAKTTVYRFLLGYYLYTKEEQVLKCVIEAVQNVMENYEIHRSEPFKTTNGFSGVTHGLMFIDVLHTLYEITDDYIYIEYAIFLIQDYNKHSQTEEDVMFKNLTNSKYRFKGHGVHTYEHFRAIILIGKYDNSYKKYIDLFLEKLNLVLQPSGGPIGDEWVMGNIADSGLHGYEFCSIHELMDSLLFLSTHTDYDYFYLAERIFKNAHYGARHTNQQIAYLKSDNSYSMSGDFQVSQPHSPHKIQTRYKYSFTHKDAAVCCVPNSVRITPYYIEHALSIDKKVRLNYIIPCEISLCFKGKNYYIHVKQDSLYGPYEIESNLGDFLVINHVENSIEIKQDYQGKYYFVRGNIVYAYPIVSIDEFVTNYNVKDTYVSPLNPYEEMTLVSISYQFDKENNCLIVDTNLGKKSLVPIAKTVLRQTTFTLE